MSCAQVIGLSSVQEVPCAVDCGVDAPPDHGIDTYVADHGIDRTPPRRDGQYYDGGPCEVAPDGAALGCPNADAPICYEGTCVACSPTSNNCGTGMICTSAAPFSCVMGCTTSAGCPSATPDCCNGQCTSTHTDPKNCGMCGTKCSTVNDTPSCFNGTCNSQCDEGFLDCKMNLQTNGCETNILTDVNNCGNCNTPCSMNNVTGQACQAGDCQGTCQLGYAHCDNTMSMSQEGCETDLNTDVNNCGGCGVKCSTNNVLTNKCTAGHCDGVCDNGFADCDNNMAADGCETNVLGSDCANCGGCGEACPGTPPTYACWKCVMGVITPIMNCP